MMVRFIIFYVMVLSGWIFQVHADSHHPQDFLNSIRGSKNEGEQIYNHYCANCHSVKPLIALGAPRIGAEDDWKLRLKQGMDVLFKNTDEGLNAMPPRGGCFECTDEQLKMAIIFMIPKQDAKTSIK